MAPPIEQSQGEPRPQNWRVDELPPKPETETAAPDRDVTTGRFVAGNAASKRRKLKRVAKQLAGLDPSKCDPWLRPFITAAADHATSLIGSLPVQTTGLNALAMTTATSFAVYQGLLALGAQGDGKALAEARQWLREHRQSLIALTGLSRQEGAAAADPYAAHRALMAEAEAEETK